MLRVYEFARMPSRMPHSVCIAIRVISLTAGGSCGCALPGIFREIVVARTGTNRCPVASGVILAVNMNMHGDAKANMGERASLHTARLCFRPCRRARPTALGGEWGSPNCGLMPMRVSLHCTDCARSWWRPRRRAHTSRSAKNQAQGIAFRERACCQ